MTGSQRAFRKRDAAHILIKAKRPFTPQREMVLNLWWNVGSQQDCRERSARWTAHGLSRPLLRREKAVGGDLENARQSPKFIIGDATQLRLNLRQGATGNIQPGQLAAGGQLILREVEVGAPLADLRADDVGRCFGSGHTLNK